MVPGQMTEADQALVLNMVELVLQLLSQQQIEIQSLKDEINRLKGEQGKPDIPANTLRKRSLFRFPSSVSVPNLKPTK